jgi:CubicO group peptidase (beta-lactamase class C family)
MSSPNMIKMDKVQEYMDAYANCGFFNGSVLVAHKGNVLISKGYGLANMECNSPNTPQTKFRIASLTKGFTSMAIMQLEEKGLLQVDQSLNQFIPDYPMGEQITIHHLLTHSSGITNHTNLPHFNDKIRPLIWSIENLINEFKHYELEFKPGERNAYCNSGYILLTFIIEQVSGQTYSEYLQEHIFNPLGMNDTGVDINRKLVPNRAIGYDLDKEFIHTVNNNMSTMLGAGALYSTVEDLYKWDQALYTNKLVSKQTLKRMFTTYFSRESCGWDVGYGWELTPLEVNCLFKNRISHRGDVEGFVSWFSRFIDDELTVIVLSNTMIAPAGVINDNLAKIVFGCDIPSPMIPNFIDVNDMQGFVGEYVKEDSITEKLSVTLEDNKLYFSPQQYKYEIHPILKQDHSIDFVADYIDERFSFLMNDQNKIDQVIYTDATGISTSFKKVGTIC